MPTYEYQCKTCGHHFERVQRFSDAPITECPEWGPRIVRGALWRSEVNAAFFEAAWSHVVHADFSDVPSGLAETALERIWHRGAETHVNVI